MILKIKTLKLISESRSYISLMVKRCFCYIYEDKNIEKKKQLFWWLNFK